MGADIADGEAIQIFFSPGTADFGKGLVKSESGTSGLFCPFSTPLSHLRGKTDRVFNIEFLGVGGLDLAWKGFGGRSAK